MRNRNPAIFLFGKNSSFFQNFPLNYSTPSKLPTLKRQENTNSINFDFQSCLVDFFCFLTFRKSIFSFLYFLSAVGFGLFPWMWKICSTFLESFGFSNSELLTSTLFLIMNSLFDKLLDLPWSAYSTFVIEEAHGFNHQVFASSLLTIRLFLSS